MNRDNHWSGGWSAGEERMVGTFAFELPQRSSDPSLIYITFQILMLEYV